MSKARSDLKSGQDSIQKLHAEIENLRSTLSIREDENWHYVQDLKTLKEWVVILDDQLSALAHTAHRNARKATEMKKDRDYIASRKGVIKRNYKEVKADLIATRMELVKMSAKYEAVREILTEVAK